MESPALFREIVRLGWHPLMRAKASGHFRPAGWHRGWRMDGFATGVGRRLGRLKRGLLLLWLALLWRQPIPTGRIDHPAWPLDPIDEAELNTS